MKLTVVLCRDRRSDPDVQVFTAPEQAVAYARQLAEEYSRGGSWPFDETRGNEGSELPLTGPMQRAGWIYYARQEDGATITVFPRELDQEIVQ